MDKKNARYTLSGLFSDSLDDWTERGGNTEEIQEAIETLGIPETVDILKHQIDIKNS